MSETNSPTEVTAPTPEDVLEHAVVENDAERTECTVYPRDCEEEELVTRWVTAQEGSYVSLAEMR